MLNGTKGWRLNVSPGDGAVGFALSTPGYVRDDDTYDDMTVRLTGPAGFSEKLYDWEWSSFNAPFASMPRGTYTLTASYDEWAHWHCSQYNPNGCSWWDADRHTAKFKFRWNGAAATASPYRATKTKLLSTVGKKNRKTGRFIVEGRVTAQRRSTSTFQPYGSLRRTKGIPVRIEMFDWDRYQWRTRKTVRTRADGTFSVKVAGSKKSRRTWRVHVVSSSEYASRTPKKFKR